MLDIQFSVNPTTEQKLRKILSHVSDEESFAQGIIDYQIQERQKSILNLKLDLKEFEKNIKYRRLYFTKILPRNVS